MTDRPSLPRAGSPLHHAIDQLTAVTLDVQHLRRQHHGVAPLDAAQISDALRQIENRLHALAEQLVALRDEASAAAEPAPESAR